MIPVKTIRRAATVAPSAHPQKRVVGLGEKCGIRMSRICDPPGALPRYSPAFGAPVFNAALSTICARIGRYPLPQQLEDDVEHRDDKDAEAERRQPPAETDVPTARRLVAPTPTTSGSNPRRGEPVP
jgi:hypothetical protein